MLACEGELEGVVDGAEVDDGSEDILAEGEDVEIGAEWGRVGRGGARTEQARSGRGRADWGLEQELTGRHFQGSGVGMEEVEVLYGAKGRDLGRGT